MKRIVLLLLVFISICSNLEAQLQINDYTYYIYQNSKDSRERLLMRFIGNKIWVSNFFIGVTNFYEARHVIETKESTDKIIYNEYIYDSSRSSSSQQVYKTSTTDYIFEDGYRTMKFYRHYLNNYQKVKLFDTYEFAYTNSEVYKIDNNMNIGGYSGGYNGGYSGGLENNPYGGGTEKDKYEQKNRQSTTMCPLCAGSGKCKTCNGKGYYYSSFDITKKITCTNCDYTHNCRNCNGTGRIRR